MQALAHSLVKCCKAVAGYSVSALWVSFFGVHGGVEPLGKGDRHSLRGALRLTDSALQSPRDRSGFATQTAVTLD